MRQTSIHPTACRKTMRMLARASSRGFSLLELMLVLAIIATLMAVAAFNFLGRGEQAKINASKQSLTIIKAALTDYNLQYSAFPPDLHTLVVAKILEDKALKDGFNSEFYYDTRGANKDHPYNLRSPGPDKQTGTEDDIDIWTMNK